jgi:hypothetical protein
MPDQTVEVFFDPNAEPQFVFLPDTVTMTNAGKIVLSRRPQDAPWDFMGGYVKDDNSGQFSTSVHGNGSKLHIRDDFRDEFKMRHSYAVTVKFNGDEYPSPDPVIVNDPGTGGTAG